MSYLTFADVEVVWRRINNRVTSHSFISALWGYCRSHEVDNWNRLFFDLNEIQKVINLFYDDGGFILDVYEDFDVRSSLPYMKRVMIPYFIDWKSQECGFIADLILKYFDVLHPDQPWRDNAEILGKRGLLARATLECSSKWCRKLAAEEFDEDIELEWSGNEVEAEVTPKKEVIPEKKGKVPPQSKQQPPPRPVKRLRMNENGRWVTM